MTEEVVENFLGLKWDMANLQRGETQMLLLGILIDLIGGGSQR